jgi:hypothetical protein
MARRKRSGWFGESHRHSLASKGIMTTTKNMPHLPRAKAQIPEYERPGAYNPPTGSYFTNPWYDLLKFTGYQTDPMTGEIGNINFDEYGLDQWEQPDGALPEHAAVRSFQEVGEIDQRDGDELMRLRNEIIDYRNDPIMFMYVRLHEELEGLQSKLEVQSKLEKSEVFPKHNALKVATHLMDELESSETPWTNVED